MNKSQISNVEKLHMYNYIVTTFGDIPYVPVVNDLWNSTWNESANALYAPKIHAYSMVCRSLTNRLMGQRHMWYFGTYRKHSSDRAFTTRIRYVVEEEGSNKIWLRPAEPRCTVAKKWTIYELCCSRISKIATLRNPVWCAKTLLNFCKSCQ